MDEKIKLNDINSETIYDALEIQMPEVIHLMETGFDKGMPITGIVDRIYAFDMPDEIKKNVVRAIRWKYNKLKEKATEQI